MMNQGPSGAYAPPTAGEYEFTEAQNASIARLASSMKFVGVMWMLLGILAAVVGFFATLGKGAVGVVALAVGVSYIVKGVLLFSPSDAFDRVVKTQGSDVANLTEALRSLKKFYTFWMVLYVVAIVLVLIGVLLVSQVGGR